MTCSEEAVLRAPGTFLASIIQSSTAPREASTVQLESLPRTVSPLLLKGEGPLRRHQFTSLKRTTSVFCVAHCVCVEIGVTSPSSPRTIGRDLLVFL